MKSSLAKRKEIIRYLEKFKLLTPPFDCPDCPVSKRNISESSLGYCPDCDKRFEAIFNAFGEEVLNSYKNSCEDLVEALSNLYYKYKDIHFTVMENE